MVIRELEAVEETASAAKLELCLEAFLAVLPATGSDKVSTPCLAADLAFHGSVRASMDSS